MKTWGVAAAWLALAVPVAAAAAEAPGGRMQSITTAYSTQFDAYVAGPAQAARGAVLVHDRWGLNAPLRAWAGRLAGLGLRVVAVDLYDGRPVRPAALAWDYWENIDPVWMEVNLDAALAHLRRQGQEDNVVVAWGRGVVPARDLAGRSPEALSAVVTYLDRLTAPRSEGTPELAVPVLEISTPESLVHPARGTELGRAGRDAWAATRRFLSKSGQ